MGSIIKFGFSAQEILKLELAAQSIITSLMDKFIPAVIYYEENDKNSQEFKQSKACRKFTALISDNYK
jgi:dGTPase